jgi:hypothetical protein
MAVKHLTAGAGHQRGRFLRRHPLASLPHGIFLFRPLLTPGLEIGLGPLPKEDAPSRLKIGLGLVEGYCRAIGAFTGLASGVKTTGPSPARLVIRDADQPRNRPDPDIAIEYLPAFLAGIGRATAVAPLGSLLRSSRTPLTNRSRSLISLPSGLGAR